jgi:Carbohydrate phosphorylase
MKATPKLQDRAQSLWLDHGGRRRLREQRVSQAYSDQNAWTRMSILNTARADRLSSDRSIREYCGHIWKVTPIVLDERQARCGP